MQYGLLQDRHFVLKSSWISKRWRETMVNDCPELWGNFDLPWREVRDKALIPKREAWVKRSGGKFHKIDVTDTPVTGVSKFTKSFENYFDTVRQLRLSMRDNKTLFRFASKFRRACRELQHLYLDGGEIPEKTESAMDQGWYLSHVLLCDLLAKSSNSTLKTLEVRNIDFREHSDASDDDELPRFGSGMFELEEDAAAYPALERLIVSGCKFDIDGSMMDAPEDPDAKDDVGLNRYWTCPLHKVLRGAENLRYLKVNCISTLTSYRTSIRQITAPDRTELPHVKTCIIPPPAVWTLDISTPNVERLSFVLPDGTSRYMYEKRHPDFRRPLIPRFKDSPVAEHQLDNITHLELECCSADVIWRFEEWLSRLPNLVSLTIHGVTHMDQVLNCRAPDPRCSQQRVDKRILQTLIQHPNWLPKLADLRLRNCETPDDCLVEFVKMRTGLDATTTLTRLTLHGLRPSRETHVWLHEEMMQVEGQASGFSFTIAPTGFGGSAEERCEDCESVRAAASCTGS